MTATVIDALSPFGFASQETALGVIIESLDEDTRAEWKFQKDNQGNRVGAAIFDDSIEVKLKGQIASTNGFSGKIAGNIALANGIATAHLLTANSGRSLVKTVKRTRSNEDFAGVEIDAELFPYFS